MIERSLYSTHHVFVRNSFRRYVLQIKTVIAYVVILCYPHVPVGKVWIYQLLFVCLFVIF